ncbi:unnamed protein product [Amoebophrya sp. A120]|nr:unnamed protein product [Amoebophrya sp. A120]|eukprot:GSA120T00004268001.1
MPESAESQLDVVDQQTIEVTVVVPPQEQGNARRCGRATVLFSTTILFVLLLLCCSVFYNWNFYSILQLLIARTSFSFTTRTRKIEGPSANGGKISGVDGENVCYKNGVKNMESQGDHEASCIDMSLSMTSSPSNHIVDDSRSGRSGNDRDKPSSQITSRELALASQRSVDIEHRGIARPASVSATMHPAEEGESDAAAAGALQEIHLRPGAVLEYGRYILVERIDIDLRCPVDGVEQAGLGPEQIAGVEDSEPPNAGRYLPSAEDRSRTGSGRAADARNSASFPKQGPRVDEEDLPSEDERDHDDESISQPRRGDQPSSTTASGRQFYFPRKAVCPDRNAVNPLPVTRGLHGYDDSASGASNYVASTSSSALSSRWLTYSPTSGEGLQLIPAPGSGDNFRNVDYGTHQPLLQGPSATESHLPGHQSPGKGMITDRNNRFVPRVDSFFMARGIQLPYRELAQRIVTTLSYSYDHQQDQYDYDRLADLYATSFANKRRRTKGTASTSRGDNIPHMLEGGASASSGGYTEDDDSYFFRSADQRDTRTRIGRGSFGEVWRALERTATGEYQEVVLKRLFTEKDEVKLATTRHAKNQHKEEPAPKGEIRRSGEREIFFGVKLRHAPHVARYLDHFSAGQNKDQMWLVFVNEGYSLLHLLWWVSADGTTVEPSPFWWSLKSPARNTRAGPSQGTGTRSPSAAGEEAALVPRTSPPTGSAYAPVTTGDQHSGAPASLLDFHTSSSSSSQHLESAAASWVVAYNNGFAPASSKSGQLQLEQALLPPAIPLPETAAAGAADERRNPDGVLLHQTLDPSSMGPLVSPPALPWNPSLSEGVEDALAVSTGGSGGRGSSPLQTLEAGGGSAGRPHPGDDQGQMSNLKVMKSIMYQLLHGLAEIHAVGITHRDIKLGNLLIREDEQHELHLRIADFGSAVFFPKPGKKDGKNIHYTTAAENLKKYEHLFSSTGPTAQEETAEYLPPEAFFPATGTTALHAGEGSVKMTADGQENLNHGDAPAGNLENDENGLRSEDDSEAENDVGSNFEQEQAPAAAMDSTSAQQFAATSSADDSTSNITTNPYYRSPSFDIFAAGLVFLEIVTGRRIDEILQVREIHDVATSSSTGTTRKHSSNARNNHFQTNSDQFASYEQSNQRKRRRLEMKYRQLGFSDKDVVNALKAHAFTDNCVRPWLHLQHTVVPGGFAGTRRNSSASAGFAASGQHEDPAGRGLRTSAEDSGTNDREDTAVLDDLDEQSLGSASAAGGRGQHEEHDHEDAQHEDRHPGTNLLLPCSENEFSQLLRELDVSGEGLPDRLARDLLRRMLVWEPELRISATEALRHPWFAVDDEAMSSGNKMKGAAAAGTTSTFSSGPEAAAENDHADNVHKHAGDFEKETCATSSQPEPDAADSTPRDVDSEGLESLRGEVRQDHLSDAPTTFEMDDGSRSFEDRHLLGQHDGATTSDGRSISRPLAYPIVGQAQAQGRRPAQEDATLALQTEVGGKTFHVFGVFDGHYGEEVAAALRDVYPEQFLRPELLAHLLQEREDAHPQHDQTRIYSEASANSDQPGLQSTREQTNLVKAAIHQSLQKFDAWISQHQSTDAGSTLTLAIMFDTTLLVAQIGDCELWFAKILDQEAAPPDVGGAERENEANDNSNSPNTDDSASTGRDHEQVAQLGDVDTVKLQEHAPDEDLAVGQKVLIKQTGDLGKIEEIRVSNSGAKKMYLVLLQQRSIRNTGEKKTKFFTRDKLEPRVNIRIERVGFSHRPDLREELARIKSRPGGFVSNVTEAPAASAEMQETVTVREGPLPRVLGKLATSRSIGRLPENLKDFVIATPDIFEYDFSRRGQEEQLSAGDAAGGVARTVVVKNQFLLIGSDGLFDAISAHESCEIVEAVLRSTAEQIGEMQLPSVGATAFGQKEVQEAAQVLVETALQRGASDNVSVVVAKILHYPAA